MGLLLWVAFAWESMKAGFGTERWSMVCYLIALEIFFSPRENL